MSCSSHVGGDEGLERKDHFHQLVSAARLEGVGGDALFAGGSFTFAGGVPVSNIAKWDGSGWATLGAGVGNSVNAMAVFDDGSGDALFVGGVFFTAGGTAANKIAKWNGSTFSPCVKKAIKTSYRRLLVDLDRQHVHRPDAEPGHLRLRTSLYLHRELE